ncbi:hypothetical protein VTK73DRAFT_1717 [Phialemonium thermophilum]|uniref:Uncharacterized protein n=1 Tax=Phialemonium thermophilum TaxID=223376 RepID=A0ABR3VT20_9PEZI
MLFDKALALSSPLVGAITSHIWAFTSLAFLVTTLSYVFYQRFFSPLAKIDGPFWASISPFWRLIQFRKGTFHETILALHQKYGPLGALQHGSGTGLSEGE